MKAARPSLWDRVAAKITFPDDLDACWGWTGALSHKRDDTHRPVIQIGGRGGPIVPVARLICTWYHGLSPTEDHAAGHTCPDYEHDTCLNPRHLRWMTKLENEAHKQTYLSREPA